MIPSTEGIDSFREDIEARRLRPSLRATEHDLIHGGEPMIFAAKPL
jgi:hypothetical protein